MMLRWGIWTFSTPFGKQKFASLDEWLTLSSQHRTWRPSGGTLDAFNRYYPNFFCIRMPSSWSSSQTNNKKNTKQRQRQKQRQQRTTTKKHFGCLQQTLSQLVMHPDAPNLFLINVGKHLHHFFFFICYKFHHSVLSRLKVAPLTMSKNEGSGWGSGKLCAGRWVGVKCIRRTFFYFQLPWKVAEREQCAS